MPSTGALLVGAVLLVFLLGRNDRPTLPVAVRTRTGNYLPVGSPGAPPSVWQARFFAKSDLLWGEFGTIVVAAGLVTFTPDNADYPSWQVPAWELKARHKGLLRFGKAPITLWMPNQEQVGLVVSQARINRFVDNDFKTITQSREAHTFLAILRANGCRVLPN